MSSPNRFLILGLASTLCTLSTADAQSDGGRQSTGASKRFDLVRGGSISVTDPSGTALVPGASAVVSPYYYAWTRTPPTFRLSEIPTGSAGGGLLLPPPEAPAGLNPTRPRRPTSRPEPAKADNLVTLGDRLFRVGLYSKAEDRYRQAVRTNPGSATPRIRLAQIALIRGDFIEAAEQIREAMTAEPGWLVNADDIQGLYSEPADFAKVVAKLERHLQAKPGDRDAWLVLGAQWYLSGRSRQAADVFLRLSDRAPDKTLSAFLDATAHIAATPDSLVP